MYCQPILINTALLPNEYWEVLLNNQPYLPNPVSSSFDICGLSLGLHTLKIRRVKADGTKCEWAEKDFLISINPTSDNFLVIGEATNLKITDITDNTGAYTYLIKTGNYPVTVNTQLTGFISTPNTYDFKVHYQDGVGTILFYVNSNIIHTYPELSGIGFVYIPPINLTANDIITFKTIN